MNTLTERIGRQLGSANGQEIRALNIEIQHGETRLAKLKRRRDDLVRLIEKQPLVGEGLDRLLGDVVE